MPKQPNWTKTDIPPQDGKLALVTGATGGLGYETALGLTEKGATVILAGRNPTKGQEALDKIYAIYPQAKISFGKVDLGSLASIRDFCTQFNNEHQVLDILVNNAGIMTPPKRETTSDGFELQLGTNYLSHFALTAQLLPALRRSSSPRVVNVASMAVRQGKIHFDDLQWEKKYCGYLSYAQSKIASLIFSFELQRKSNEGGWGLTVTTAHPGYARTDLLANGPGDATFLSKMIKFMQPFTSHSAAEGALASLFAATSLDAQPFGYYGPQDMFEMKGPVGPANIPCEAKDEKVAKKLWDISTELTGVTWP